jgi:hypothetical protein
MLAGGGNPYEYKGFLPPINHYTGMNLVTKAAG